MGGNMKNVEEYAQDRVNENNERSIIKLRERGFTVDEIIDTLNVTKDFVEKTLAK